MNAVDVKFPQKAILLDFDGTAVDSEAIHLITFNEIADQINGSCITKDEWLKNCTGGYSNIWQLLTYKGEELGRKFDIPEAEFTQLAKEIYYKNLDKLKAREGMKEMLEHYQQNGFTIAVVSGSPSYLIEKGLDVTGLKPYVNAVFGSDTIKKLGGTPKPAADSYLLAAKEIGVPTNLCVAFEDSASGCKAAHEAGIPVFQFRHSPALDHMTSLSPHATDSSAMPHVSQKAWSFPNQI